MGKKLENTPRSRIRSALRQLWLRSRERAKALKLAGRSCQVCGVKASVAKGKEIKVEVHHIHGIQNWEALIEAVYQMLLCSPDHLLCLCETCHDERHRTP